MSLKVRYFILRYGVIMNDSGYVSLSDDRARFFKSENIATAAGVALGTIVSVSPVLADTTTPLADLTTTVTAIGTFVGTIAGVALLAVGFRVGMKMFNRMTVKG